LTFGCHGRSLTLADDGAWPPALGQSGLPDHINQVRRIGQDFRFAVASGVDVDSACGQSKRGKKTGQRKRVIS